MESVQKLAINTSYTKCDHDPAHVIHEILNINPSHIQYSCTKCGEEVAPSKFEIVSRINFRLKLVKGG